MGRQSASGGLQWVVILATRHTSGGAAAWPAGASLCLRCLRCHSPRRCASAAPCPPGVLTRGAAAAGLRAPRVPATGHAAGVVALAPALYDVRQWHSPTIPCRLCCCCRTTSCGAGCACYAWPCCAWRRHPRCGRVPAGRRLNSWRRPRRATSRSSNARAATSVNQRPDRQLSADIVTQESSRQRDAGRCQHVGQGVVPQHPSPACQCTDHPLQPGTCATGRYATQPATMCPARSGPRAAARSTAIATWPIVAVTQQAAVASDSGGASGRHGRTSRRRRCKGERGGVLAAAEMCPAQLPPGTCGHVGLRGIPVCMCSV